MTFEKSVLFLGSQEMHLSDGGIYHQVQFFDKDSGPVQVNVMDSSEVMKSIRGLEFGSPLVVTFALRPKDRLWRLVIDHVG